MRETFEVPMDFDSAVKVAIEVVRECISNDAALRAKGMIDPSDRSCDTLMLALDYLAGDGTAASCARDCDGYARGFEDGAFAGDAGDVGMVGYSLGQREERARCVWLAERMADGRGTDWDLACHALADAIRGTD